MENTQKSETDTMNELKHSFILKRETSAVLQGGECFIGLEWTLSLPVRSWLQSIAVGLRGNIAWSVK